MSATARCLGLCLMLLLTGCATPPKPEARQPSAVPEPQPLPEVSEPVQPPVARVQPAQPEPLDDPVAYLRWVEERFSTMQQYTLTFERTERRGLGFFKSMRGPEEIQCWYRREPFSIRMKWLDPQIKYGESSYVRGQFGDRVRFIPRHGLFGLPPTLTRVSLQTPVTWGEARYPVSDFGYERVLEKTLDVIDLAGVDGAVTYLGEEDYPDGRAHAIRIEVPQGLSDTPRSELLFDLNSHLLVQTRLYNASGKPEATYRYSNLDLDVSLTDADFLLDGEQPTGEGAVASSEAIR